MPSLLSGSTLRRGGSGEFIDLAGAQPQLPATETTLTGFTLVTNELLQTSYRSSLGFVEFHTASMYSALPEGTIRILATGSTFLSTTTTTGNLVVQGGIGVGGNMIIEEDIVVNGITFGTGWEGQNNIVVRGTAQTPINNFNNGQESIAIGYDSMLGLSTAYKNIAIGRFALNSGTNVSHSIAIGDSALREIGWRNSIDIGSVIDISQTVPAVVQINNHGLTTGTKVVINDATGMTEVNTNYYWVNWLSTNTVALYTDNIVSAPLNAIGFNAYPGGGILGRVLTRNNNIAIGNNAAEKLIDGEKNFFFGDSIAKNLITGTSNFFIGSDVANNVTQGSGIISIASDNLVDGRDNQVAIGSVFYYDGTGTATVNANTEIGIGTQSTSTNTGGLTVIGGAGIQRNLHVGEELHVTSSTFFTGDVFPATTTTNLGSLANPFNALYLKGSTLYLSTVTLKSYNDLSFSVESSAGYVRQTIGNLTLNSGEIATGVSDGSLRVQGGMGVQGDAFFGGSFNVIGTEDADISPAGADVFLQPTIGGSVVIEPNATGYINNMIIGNTNPADASFDNVYAATGSPDESNLLYTPRSTVSTSAPVSPRVGDFWINPAGPYFLQYVNDAGNKIWVQI